MGVEEQRKKFMASPLAWGDIPHADSSQALTPRDRTPQVEEPWYGQSASDAEILDMPSYSDPPNPSSIFSISSTISSKNWTLGNLVATSSNFRPVPRTSSTCRDLESALNEFERTGVPLIIEGWNEHAKWPSDMFHIDWFRDHGPQDISARNVHDWTDQILPLSDFVAKSRTVPSFAEPNETERLYGKDAECPAEWSNWLGDKVLPSSLLPDASDNFLQCLPKSAKVETLMCYLGIGDTFTPCHKDLCASSGQNLMCYTENDGSSYWFMTETSASPEVAEYFHQLGQEIDHENHIITVEELASAPFTVYIAEQKLGDLVLVPPRSCHQVVNHGGITIKTSWSRMTLQGLATALYHELPIYRRVCRSETYRVKSIIYHTLIQKATELHALISQPARDAECVSSASTSRDSTPAVTRLPVSSSRNDPPTASPADKDHKDKLASTVKQLLNLFDYIIIEEHSEDYPAMPCLMPSLPSTSTSSVFRLPSPSPSTSSSATLTHNEKERDDSHLTCDFCGADIFQSFFECRDCVSSPSDAMEDISGGKVAFGDGFVICAGCYVEGRSCSCGSMTPSQYRPFDDILQDRTRTIEALRAYDKVEGKVNHRLLENQALLSDANQIGLFKAACVLQRSRNSKRGTRVCTFRNTSHTHPVAWAAALYCKKCHFTRCFTHISTAQYIHSAEALITHSKDDTHAPYHSRHQKGKLDFERAKGTLLEAEQKGARPVLRYQLVKMAMTFNTCKPVSTEFVKPGWYDVHVQLQKIPSSDSGGVTGQEAPIEAPIESAMSSPLSSVPSSPRLAPTDDLDLPSMDGLENLSHRKPRTVSALESLPKKRKRMVFEGVFVPRLSELKIPASLPKLSLGVAGSNSRMGSEKPQPAVDLVCQSPSSLVHQPNDYDTHLRSQMPNDPGNSTKPPRRGSNTSLSAPTPTKSKRLSKRRPSKVASRFRVESPPPLDTMVKSTVPLTSEQGGKPSKKARRGDVPAQSVEGPLRDSTVPPPPVSSRIEAPLPKRLIPKTTRRLLRESPTIEDTITDTVTLPGSEEGTKTSRSIYNEDPSHHVQEPSPVRAEKIVAPSPRFKKAALTSGTGMALTAPERLDIPQRVSSATSHSSAESLAQAYNNASANNAHTESAKEPRIAEPVAGRKWRSSETKDKEFEGIRRDKSRATAESGAIERLKAQVTVQQEAIAQLQSQVKEQAAEHSRPQIEASQTFNFPVEQFAETLAKTVRIMVMEATNQRGRGWSRGRGRGYTHHQPHRYIHHDGPSQAGSSSWAGPHRPYQKYGPYREGHGDNTQQHVPSYPQSQYERPDRGYAGRKQWASQVKVPTRPLPTSRGQPREPRWNGNGPGGRSDRNWSNGQRPRKSFWPPINSSGPGTTYNTAQTNDRRLAITERSRSLSRPRSLSPTLSNSRLVYPGEEIEESERHSRFSSLPEGESNFEGTLLSSSAERRRSCSRHSSPPASVHWEDTYDLGEDEPPDNNEHRQEPRSNSELEDDVSMQHVASPPRQPYSQQLPDDPMSNPWL